MNSNNQNEITIFAETTFRNQYRKFGIKKDDRRRHMYFIGKTGMGKSTVLENMIIEDIRAGLGVAVVDPHGDLAEKVIEYIPTSRINEVIYFNPADIDYPIAFNVVEQVDPRLRHLVASGLIGVFQKLWADSWGPRLEYILRNAILAVLDYPGSTLLAVTRMLSDKVFRKKVIDKIQDPVVKAFWVNEFTGYADKFAAEAVSPIQNKVGQFLSSSLIRNIVGQVKSTIDMREIMDQGKILILNLSKGRIGEDNSALLGAMMITKIQLAAMSRVDLPEYERKDFYFYVDEFQNFITDSFANILSEARKYRLNLILAHQYIEQLGEKVQAAVFGNVGTLAVFRIGAADAEILKTEFLPTFDEEDLVNLPRYEIYLKLMIDGIASEPFSGRGLLPLAQEEKTGNKEKAIKVSRERYAKERSVVDEKITRWHTIGDENEKEDRINKTEKKNHKNKPQKIMPNVYNKIKSNSLSKEYINPAPFRRSPATKEVLYGVNIEPRPRNFISGNNPAASGQAFKKYGIKNRGEQIGSTGPAINKINEIYKYQAVCSRCGRQTMTPFKPDGIRPVFCRECLSLVWREKKMEIENRKKTKKKELEKMRIQEISLSEAMRKKPVDFQGKEIISRRQKEFKAKKDNGEGELREGEEVRF